MRNIENYDNIINDEVFPGNLFLLYPVYPVARVSTNNIFSSFDFVYSHMFPIQSNRIESFTRPTRHPQPKASKRKRRKINSLNLLSNKQEIHKTNVEIEEALLVRETPLESSSSSGISGNCWKLMESQIRPEMQRATAGKQFTSHFSYFDIQQKRDATFI